MAASKKTHLKGVRKARLGERVSATGPQWDEEKQGLGRKLQDHRHTFQESALSDDNLPDQAGIDVSSDEENVSSLTARGLSYTALLQALNSSAGRGEPQRKKRRTSDALESKLAVKQPEANHSFQDQDDSSLSEVGEDQAEAFDGSESVPSDEEDESDPFDAHLSEIGLETLSDASRSASKLDWKREPSVRADTLRYTAAFPEYGLSKGLRKSPNIAQNVFDLRLKQKLQRSRGAQKLDFSHPNNRLASLVFNYKDVMFGDRDTFNAQTIRQIYCLHALNHVLKTRDRIIKHSMKLSKAHEEDERELRDQGFTRPKVLFLLPNRQSCVRVVEALIMFLEPEQQENRKRFFETFSASDDLIKSDKPDDFKELFSGNDDDRFLLGLKLTRKTVKYFASFYNSDIIFASPLGLCAKITAEDKKKRDWDFLSSIELMIIDQADAMLMQNWENVETILDHLNLEPKQAHGCDFARVRRWYLENCAKYYRQTLTFSAFITPELNKLYDNSMMNVSGKFKFARSQYNGAITRLSLQVRQTFSRFESFSPSTHPDSRFKYFTTSVVPTLGKLAQAGDGRLEGTLIFIPSYIDFLRVQNFFTYSNDTHGITFDPADLPCVSEYTPNQQNARARSLFQNGKHSILLYTGRAHHFYRFKLRGVKRIIFYCLPENGRFYEELVGGYLSKSVMEGRFTPNEVGVQSLFSKYDAMALERIVGSARYETMLREKGDVFEFS